MNYNEAFSVLGLSESASEEEIKRAYLRMAKKFRPELDPDGFKRIRSAYDTLCGNAYEDDSSFVNSYDDVIANFINPEKTYHDDPELTQQIDLHPELARDFWEPMLMALAHPLPASDLINRAFKLVQNLFEVGADSEGEKLYQVVSFIVTKEIGELELSQTLGPSWALTQRIYQFKSQAPIHVYRAILKILRTGDVNIQPLVVSMTHLTDSELAASETTISAAIELGAPVAKLLSDAYGVAQELAEAKKSKKQESTYQRERYNPRDRTKDQENYRTSPPPENEFPFNIDLEEITRPVVQEVEKFFDGLFGGKK